MNLLVIDVGGTEIKYCTMDETYVPKNASKRKTPLTGLEDYLAAIEEIYRQFEGKVEGVALSVPGVVDPDTGYQRTGGTLDSFVHELPMGELISQRLGGVRVAMENDAKAAGYAELVAGALKDCNNGVAVLLGTGIGGCIVVNHQILRGVNDFAGELSALILDNSRTVKNLGDVVGYPVWATYNGINALLAALSEKTGENPADLNGYIFFDRANAGDSVALDVLRTYCRQICVPISIMQVMIDAEVIAIGGGISNQPLMIKMLNEAYDEFLVNDFAYQIHMKKKPVITDCRFHNTANQVGAYCNFVRVYQKAAAH